jgi:hypothetical protein
MEICDNACMSLIVLPALYGIAGFVIGVLSTYTYFDLGYPPDKKPTPDTKPTS